MLTYKRSLSFLVALLTSLIAVPTNATAFNGDLYFTVYAGAPNVKKTSFSYDTGTATFSLGSIVNIGTTYGADGIAGNPQNSDLLLIGGQGPRINTISKSTGTATIYSSPVSVFHLAVTDNTTVYGSGIPGYLARHTINPDGSLSAGTSITLSGDNTTITSLISTPSGFYYTSSGSGGFGNFGTLEFTTPTTATTSAYGSYAAAHGGMYDPFTNSIILTGDGHISQFDLTGSMLADLALGGTYDQGTVDGLGHLYAANNNGNLTFIDFSTSGLINSGFVSTQFLAPYLDDVAPLIGSGSTGRNNNVPEPGTLILLSLGLIATASRYRANRSNQ